MEVHLLQHMLFQGLLGVLVKFRMLGTILAGLFLAYMMLQACLPDMA